MVGSFGEYNTFKKRQAIIFLKVLLISYLFTFTIIPLFAYISFFEIPKQFSYRNAHVHRKFHNNVLGKSFMFSKDLHSFHAFSRFERSSATWLET